MLNIVLSSSARKTIRSVVQVFLSLVLVAGLLPVLPQQAQAEPVEAQEALVEVQAQAEQEAQPEQETQDDTQLQAIQQAQEELESAYLTEEYFTEAYSGYRVYLYGYGTEVTVDIYQYNTDTGEYDLQKDDVDPSYNPIWGLPGTQYRVDYNIPENTKPESKISMRDGVTCEAVEGKEYAWIFTFPDTAPSDYSESSISVSAYTQSSVTCEEVENGTITYKFIEGDAYDGTVQATFTPASGYVLEKAEYKRSGTNFEGSWSELTTEKQEDGTYTAQFKVNKSTTSYTYSIRATFVKTEKLDIVDEAGLLAFAARVKNGESFAGSTVTLKNNIALTNAWDTITDTAFRGTFDGDGHTISNFSLGSFKEVSYSSSSTKQMFGGFFYSTKDATIKDLTIEGEINISDTDNSYYLGTFCYSAVSSTFENCTSKVDITLAKSHGAGGIAKSASQKCNFINCINEGNITCTDECDGMGGIVGSVTSYTYTDGQYTTFTNCANYGDVIYASTGASSGNASGYDFGGIVGKANNGQFEGCVNKGNVTSLSRGAGICGYLDASSGSGPYSFLNCYNTGDITVSSSATKRSGEPVAAGMCAMEPASTSIKASFTNCYNTGTITRKGTLAEANPNTCVGQIAPTILLSGSDYLGWNNYDMVENGNWTMTNCYGADDTFDASKLGSAYRDEAAGVTGGSPLLTWEPADATNSKARIAATSVTLDATTLSLEQYDEYTLNATVEPTSTTDKIEWTSSNEKVATVASSASANTKGVITCVGAGECIITATAGEVSASCALSVSAYDGTLLYGGEEVTSGGTYKLASTAKGTITIATIDPVTVRGMGAGKAQRYQNSIYFDCTGQITNLTLKDMYLSNSGNTNLVNFAGKGNILSIEGTCVLDYEASSYSSIGHEALIHVPQGTSLTVKGTGTLYSFKHNSGALIGGDNAELNGEITLAMEGEMYLKGSKQGAVIGSGGNYNSTAEASPGAISFESGTYNLISNSGAAVVGGSAGSGGAAFGTMVYLRGGSVNINCDWSGSAIGGGGYKGGNDSDGGTLVVTGGSLRTYVDKNAVNNLEGATFYKGLPLVEGINNVEVTADRQNDNGEDVFMCVIDTKEIPANEAGEYEVTVDGEAFFTGGLHSYAYLNEAIDRTPAGSTEKADTSVDYTPDNWVKSIDTCLYLYVTGEDHTIEVNGQTVNATYNASAEGTAAETNGGSFTTNFYVAGDINNNARINIVDAQLCYDLARGNYKSGDDPYGAFPLPEGWNTATLIAAVDVTGDGVIAAEDAFAIQYYAHYGKFA